VAVLVPGVRGDGVPPSPVPGHVLGHQVQALHLLGACDAASISHAYLRNRIFTSQNNNFRFTTKLNSISAFS